MKPRQYFHLFRILEDYAQDYISFEDSPRFILPKDYPLTVSVVSQHFAPKEKEDIIQLSYEDLEVFWGCLPRSR
jgi:hypothetical protein